MENITLVVPIYNVEPYLDRCLASIASQSYKDFNVLCINDGSTDDSQTVINRYLKDSRFFSYQKVNGGLSDARNFGLERVKTPYVAFIDSDDFLEPDFLKLGMNRMIKDELDMVVMNYYQRFDELDRKEEIHLPFNETEMYALSSHPDLLAYMNNAAWNKIYKTELFRAHHITYPFGYRHQDLGTTFRILYFCQRIGFIQKPLYNYLADRPDNLTQQVDHKIDHILDMIQINVDFYKEQGAFDSNYEALKYLSGINTLQSLRKLPKLTNQTFVFDFIDRCFGQLKKAFPDFPHCSYPLHKEAHARIYLHPNLLKWYYRYTQLRKKA